MRKGQVSRFLILNQCLLIKGAEICEDIPTTVVLKSKKGAENSSLKALDGSLKHKADISMM